MPQLSPMQFGLSKYLGEWFDANEQSIATGGTSREELEQIGADFVNDRDKFAEKLYRKACNEQDAARGATSA